MIPKLRMYKLSCSVICIGLTITCIIGCILHDLVYGIDTTKGNPLVLESPFSNFA